MFSATCVPSATSSAAEMARAVSCLGPKMSPGGLVRIVTVVTSLES